MNVTDFSKNKTISYAQNAEDIVLYRLFKNKKKGFYIDVGAAHPIYDNVTKLFYDLGWSGINIEPLKNHYDILVQERKRDTNLSIGISNTDGALVFYYFPDIDGWSTIDKKRAEDAVKKGHKYEKLDIEVKTLSFICKQYVSQEIDFLKIDVEGHELSVLQGADWVQFRPKVVVYEDEFRDAKIDEFLRKQKYLFALFDGLNSFYVRAEDKKLLSVIGTSANVFDSFIPYKYLQPIEQLAFEKNKLLSKVKEINQTQKKLKQCLDEVKEAENRYNQLLANYQKLDVRLQEIYLSKTWRFFEKIARVLSIILPKKHVI